jgi:hypothetical protein
MNKKLYAVKNDEGKYWDFYDIGGFWQLSRVSCSISEDTAKNAVKEHGGHVVTLIEEPEKLVLTKEQAEIVENAHDEEFPATYISDSTNLAFSGEEDLLMKAYVNGWTVKRPQRWYVKTPDNWIGKEKQGWLFKIGGSIRIVSEKDCEHTADEQFTEAEIEHYGLQGFEKEEVTDDEQ